MNPYTPLSGDLIPWTPGIFTLAVFAAVIVGLMMMVLFLTGWLGTKVTGPEKERPYEGGVIPTGSARYRHPVPFYLVAAFFLIFDVEAAFIFSWAVAFKPLGWAGWLRMSYFIIVLLVSLIYLWSKGGLDWGPGKSEG